MNVGAKDRAATTMPDSVVRSLTLASGAPRWAGDSHLR